MKPYLILLVTFYSISCKTEKAKNFFSFPDRKEIVSIVESIADSLPIQKNTLDTILNTEYHSLSYLASDLRKFKIFLSDTVKPFSPPNTYSLDIKTLFRLKLKNKPFFTKNDSAYFLFQNDSVKNIDLSNELKSKYFLTKIKIYELKQGQAFYEISVPIFSADNKKACIILSYVCNSNCSYSNYMLLEKFTGKWRIEATEMRSVN